MNSLAQTSNNGQCVICPDCLECITCGLCICGHSRRIDLDHLAHALRTMKARSKLYQIVKVEMQRRHRWKDLRGYYAKTQSKKDRD